MLSSSQPSLLSLSTHHRCSTTSLVIRRGAMTLPNSLDLTAPSHSRASQLFSLPRIPYFFTITPYPLGCQSVQRTLSPNPNMKRRYSSTTPSQRNHNTPSNGYTPVPSIVNEPPAYTSQPQTEDQGIEGRVLKRMRRIKLNSDSPPLNSPIEPMHAPENDLIGVDHSQITPIGTYRAFGPIKISTRSGQGSEASGTIVVHESASTVMLHKDAPLIGDSEAAEYSGMNSVLYQVHVARFGTPTELPSNVEGTSSTIQSQRQQPQYLQHLSQEVMFTANTAWHQVQSEQVGSGQAMDEDDEMSDVVDGSDSEYSFTANSQRHPIALLDHIQGQGALVYGFPLGVNQQQDEQQDRIDNSVYQDINSKLRAAFLARAEIHKRYR